MQRIFAHFHQNNTNFIHSMFSGAHTALEKFVTAVVFVLDFLVDDENKISFRLNLDTAAFKSALHLDDSSLGLTQEDEDELETIVDMEIVTETFVAAKFILKQTALRNFWVEHYRDRQTVLCDDFCDRLESNLLNYRAAQAKKQRVLKGLVSASKEIRNSMQIFRRILSSLSITTSAASSASRSLLRCASGVDVDGDDLSPRTAASAALAQVDLTTVAALFRFIRHDEQNLYNAVLAINEIQIAKCCWLVPPPPPKQFGYDETFLSALNVTFNKNNYVSNWARPSDVASSSVVKENGFISIVGPAKSGKSTTLLQACYRLPKESKDCIWIDFAGVTTEHQAVAQACAQLGFHASPDDLPGLVAELRALMQSLRQGSVVVFDNLNGKKISNNSLNGTPKARGGSGGDPLSALSTFISDVIVTLGREFMYKLFIVVVGEVLDREDQTFGRQFSISGLLPPDDALTVVKGLAYESAVGEPLIVGYT
jgi:hypothetical protein